MNYAIIRALNLITWIITGILTGLSLFVIVDSLFLSTSSFSTPPTVDNPEAYIVQRVNETRTRLKYPPIRHLTALNQVANNYTLEYQASMNVRSMDSVRLVYDLYRHQYFIGDIVHQINGLVMEPISETSLNTVAERVQAYMGDPAIEDMGVSILVNDDNTFYYMVLLTSSEKLTSPYAYPSYIGEYSPMGQMNAILIMLNNARSEQGLSQLRPNPILTQVAYNHSIDQAQRDRMGHDGSNGSNPQSRIRDAGYQGNAAGENVLVRPNAYAAGAFNQWWNSPDHYQTMMYPSFTEVGIAFAISPDGKNFYYTMALGG